MNEDLAALFHGTYARLALKARRLLPCVLCALRPRLTLVTDDKVERVVELVVSCVAVPVLPLPHLQLQHARHGHGPSHHRSHRRSHHHHRRHHRRHHHRGDEDEDEPAEEGEGKETPLAPLPPLVAPPPPLLPPGLSAYLQALAVQHSSHGHRQSHRLAAAAGGGGGGGSGSSPTAAGGGADGMAPNPSPSLLLPLSPLLGVGPMPAHHPTTPTPTPSSSSLIGRVASLTKSGGQTLLRRGQRALQLAATPLFSSSRSVAGAGAGMHDSSQQPPYGGALSLVTPTTNAAGMGVAGAGLPDPRSLVELSPLSSVPGARVVRYLGKTRVCVCG